MSTEELDSCELGTQDYWNKRYKKEVQNFKDYGDVGDVWFGEDIVDRITHWLKKKQLIKTNDAIMDLGCGNGMLLVELAEMGFANLIGVDYSPDAIVLSKSVAKEHGLKIKFEVKDILNNELGCGLYDLVLDKGTYDAISLAENPKDKRCLYIKNVFDCVKNGGYFLITSCNWTQEELCGHFEEKFKFFEQIPTPQFKFGGKVGNIVTSLVFRKQ